MLVDVSIYVDMRVMRSAGLRRQSLQASLDNQRDCDVEALDLGTTDGQVSAPILFRYGERPKAVSNCIAASAVLADPVDLVGDETMSLAVHRIGVVGAFGFDETKDLSSTLVDPVAEVFHPVVILSFQVLLVGSSDIGS